MKPTRFEWGCGLLALIAVWIAGFLAMQIPLLFAKDEAAYALLAGLAMWVIVGIVGFWRYVRWIRNGSADAEARTGGNPTRVPSPLAESPGAISVQTRPRKMFNVRWTLKFSLVFFGLIALWTGGILVGCLPNVLRLELSDRMASCGNWFFIGTFFFCPVALFFFVWTSARSD